MPLLTHALELDLSDGQRLRVCFASDAATTIALDQVELTRIELREMDALCDDGAPLLRRAAGVADRIEQSLEQRLPGRERMAVVAAARWWLQVRPALRPRADTSFPSSTMHVAA